MCGLLLLKDGLRFLQVCLSTAIACVSVCTLQELMVAAILIMK